MPHPLVYDPVEASRERWIQQGWGDTAAGMAAVVSVMRAEQIFLNRAATILRPLGLTFARYQVLGMLRWTGPLTLGAVGHRLWITPATVTSAVDRLEKAGLESPGGPSHRCPGHAGRDHRQGPAACSTARSRS